METAKIISLGFTNSKDTNDPHKRKVSLVPLIERLKYVSEETKPYDRSQPDDIKTSQSTTTAFKSSVYADFLNNHFKGYDIDTSVVDIEGINGVEESEMANYYNKFLEEYILSNNTSLLEESNKLNVIVSHGGYIRMNISEPQQILESGDVLSKIKHPRNIECFLVEYTVDEEGQITCKKSENVQLFPNVIDYLDTNINIFKNSDEKRIRYPCNLSYENDIKKIGMHPDFFSSEEEYKENQTFKGIGDDQL